VKKKSLVLVPMFVAAAAFAQMRENVTVQVVNVPVHVISTDGDPVTGLTRENFQLFVNGKPQKIDYFDAIDFATLSPDQKSDPRQRRLYTLVFDLTASMNELQRAQHAALDLLDKAPENHTFAVASIGLGPMKMVVPFTRDRLALRHAVRSLKVSLSGDPLHLGLTSGERGGEAGRPTRLEDPRFDVNVGDIDWEYEKRLSQEIFELGELATRLGGMEGYKHVVFLSPGFNSTALTGIVTDRRPGDVRTGPLSSLYRVNNDIERPLRYSPNAALMTDIRFMHEKFAKAGVFLDAIDIAGLRYMQTLYDNESLYALTRETGGTVIDRRNDLAKCLNLLMDRQRVVYVLGFVPPRTNKDPNSINVKLVNVPRGLHASFRPSYSSTADPTDSADRLLLADIVTSDIPQNGVTTAANVETAPGQATIEMDIPGPEVLAHAVAGMIGAEAMLYVFNGPTVVNFKTKKVTIDVAKAEGGLASGAPLRVRETFDLPPGKYAAKVLVRIDGSGALGFARKDFEITN
jgi:VWFA-related protein